MRFVLLAAAAIALVLLPSAGAGPGVTARVSVGEGGEQGNGHSLAPVLSGDGRLVAFYSEASNLVAGDTNNARDVFVRDLESGATTRVSVSGTGAQADGHSFAPALSSDGRVVAFSSFASNLVTGDTNGVDDIFVYDREARTASRVTATGGVQANGPSNSPALDGSGRFVAFASDATNLVADDANGARDIFLHDRLTGATKRVSIDTAGAGANGHSFSPVLSGNGRYVAFYSYATNLVADDANEGADIFVHDRETGATTRASLYDGGIEVEGDSLRPSLSADGRYVAFESDAWNMVWGDTNDSIDVFVHDRHTRMTSRVSVDDSGDQGSGLSARPVLSADGRFVAFSSEAADLVPGDTNGASDVLVHDRLSGATTRMSLDPVGADANGDSLRPSLSADGRFTAFDSAATNLVVGDTNRLADVFVNDVAATPPPPPPPPAQCRVPRVVGLRLATARTRIRRANCSVGRVRRARARGRVGRVIAQSPRAGLRRPRGTRVNLVVGRR